MVTAQEKWRVVLQAKTASIVTDAYVLAQFKKVDNMKHVFASIFHLRSYADV